MQCFSICPVRQRREGFIVEKTGVPENDECHCLTVFEQAVLFGCGIDGKDTASPKTPKQWHRRSTHSRKILHGVATWSERQFARIVRSDTSVNSVRYLEESSSALSGLIDVNREVIGSTPIRTLIGESREWTGEIQIPSTHYFLLTTFSPKAFAVLTHPLCPCALAT